MNFEEVKKVFEKYVIKSDNIYVIEGILNQCSEDTINTFISESGQFLTDSFTFLKEMDNVPHMYRERLFHSFYGTKKTDIEKKWFKKLFRIDKTYNKRLSSHVLCLMRGFINEQKRKYGIENVKTLKI